jgi:hypothetical protein
MTVILKLKLTHRAPFLACQSPSTTAASSCRHLRSPPARTVSQIDAAVGVAETRRVQLEPRWVPLRRARTPAYRRLAPPAAWPPLPSSGASPSPPSATPLSPQRARQAPSARPPACASLPRCERPRKRSPLWPRVRRPWLSPWRLSPPSSSASAALRPRNRQQPQAAQLCGLRWRLRR